jgi:DNA-binding transcriptional regulator YiaG
MIATETARENLNAPITRTEPQPTGGLKTQPARPGTGGGAILNTVATLRDRARFLSDDVGALREEIDNLHCDVRGEALDERTSAIALGDPHDLIATLAQEFGLSWATIARLLRVSPTAVRKWRRGEPIAPENRRGLARAVAFLRMVEQGSSPLQDPASWLEMPLSDEATLTPVDLYLRGATDPLLDHAAGRLSSTVLLDRAVPDWRETHSTDGRFKVETAADGMPVIVEVP